MVFLRPLAWHRLTKVAALALAAGIMPGWAQELRPTLPENPGRPQNILPEAMLPEATPARMPEAMPAPMPAPMPESPSASPSESPTESMTQATAPRVGGAVVVGDLGTIEGPVAGTLDAMHGGLGSDAWQSSDRAAMERLLETIPVAAPSAAARLLWRKAVLSTAPPPLGSADKSFNALRLTRLLDAGLVGDAADLAVAMSAPMNMVILRAQADALVYAGRDLDACGDITAVRSQSAEPFWVELRAYCLALGGASPTLDLTRSVIEEQGLADPAFLTLLDGMVSGKPVAPTVIRLPDAVHALMLARLKLPMTLEMASEAGLPDALLVAGSAQTAKPLRMAAATRAFRADLLPVAQTRAILDLSTFTPAQLIGAPALARAEPLLDALARLSAALKAPVLPAARAEFVHTAFEIGEREGLLGPVARLFAAEAGEIVPAPDWSNWSELMVRGLLLAGNTDAALRWFAILNARDPARAALAGQLRIVLAFAQPNGGDPLATNAALLALATRANPRPPPPSPAPPPQYERRPVLDAMGTPVLDPTGMPLTDLVLIPPPPPPPAPELPKPPAAVVARATLDLGLFDALARPMPGEARAAVAPLMMQQSPGRRPPADLMQRIDRASLAGSRGEVALAVAAALGARGAGDLAPDIVVRLVRALRTAGIDDGAAALAAEALLQRSAEG